MVWIKPPYLVTLLVRKFIYYCGEYSVIKIINQSN